MAARSLLPVSSRSGTSSVHSDPSRLLVVPMSGVLCVVAYFAHGPWSYRFFDVREDVDVYDKNDDYEDDFRDGFFSLSRLHFGFRFVTFASSTHIYLLDEDEFYIFSHADMEFDEGPKMVHHQMIDPFVIGYHAGRGYVMCKDMSGLHFEAFDEEAGNWVDLMYPPVPVHLRVDVEAAAFVRDTIVVSTSLSTTYIYNIRGNSWRQVHCGTCLPKCGIHVVYGRRLYAVGVNEPSFGLYTVDYIDSDLVRLGMWLVDGVPMEHPRVYGSDSRVRSRLSRGWPIGNRVAHHRRAHSVLMVGSRRLCIVRSGHLVEHVEADEEESCACFDAIFSAFSAVDDVVSDVRSVSYVFHSRSRHTASHLVGCFYFPFVERDVELGDDLIGNF